MEITDAVSGKAEMWVTGYKKLNPGTRYFILWHYCECPKELQGLISDKVKV